MHLILQRFNRSNIYVNFQSFKKTGTPIFLFFQIWLRLTSIKHKSKLDYDMEILNHGHPNETSTFQHWSFYGVWTRSKKKIQIFERTNLTPLAAEGYLSYQTTFPRISITNKAFAFCFLLQRGPAREGCQWASIRSSHSDAEEEMRIGFRPAKILHR